MNIQDSWATNANIRSNENDLVFHRWFDNGENMHQIVANGSIDFYHRIFTHQVYDIIGDPRDKSCLEIGFGGGRLLRPALEVFKNAYGIDVSNNDVFDRVQEYLNRFVHNKDRFKLLHRNDASMIADKSISFTYSFIVFQHFDSLNEVEFYFNLLNRVMKDNDVCGRVCYLEGDSDKLLIDSFEQNDRSESLMIKQDTIESIARNNNFMILENTKLGQKKLWQTNVLSSQTMLTFYR